MYDRDISDPLNIHKRQTKRFSFWKGGDELKVEVEIHIWDNIFAFHDLG